MIVVCDSRDSIVFYNIFYTYSEKVKSDECAIKWNACKLDA